MSPTSHYHPELVTAAKRAPRFVVRSWTVPILNALARVVFSIKSPGERIDLEHCSVFMFRPQTPPKTPGPAMMWLHGGGLVIGDARSDAALFQRYANALGMPVCSVQYRLSSKHPFPAPLHDCKAALEWLAGQPDIDPSKIVIAGNSAGGGLAAGLCLLCREQGDITPCMQVLIYPMLDDRTSHQHHPDEHAFRLWDRRSNQLGWDRYLHGHDRATLPPYAVPARAESLANLPPTWIGVGALDLFFDENLAYASRLEEAGVPTTLLTIDGAFHAFDMMAPDAPITKTFFDAQIQAITARLQELA